LWSAATGGSNDRAAPLAAPGVVVASGSNSLSVFSAATGALQWTVPVGASVTGSSPTGGDGVGYLLGNDDRLYAFATTSCGAATCAPFWSTTVGPNNTGAGLPGYDGPVVAGGRLFLRSGDGLLQCLEPS
jgi:outer membrane protein assembly factor BamB